MLNDVLDTPETARQRNLEGELNAFPYINGRLLAGRLRTPQFTAKMRDQLFDAARQDWSGVSPAIFGSLFQPVMNAQERCALRHRPRTAWSIFSGSTRRWSPRSNG